MPIHVYMDLYLGSSMEQCDVFSLDLTPIQLITTPEKLVRFILKLEHI